MDLIAIGKFIQEKRKGKNLTQSELAEKLGITDRAISKWENGNCLPDAGTMPELCKILSISINDLFSGKMVDMKNNEKELEKNLLEMTKLKEERDKQMLLLEIVIGYLSSVTFLVLIFIASYLEMANWLRAVLIVFATIEFAVGMYFALLIEQKAGYYECSNCHNKYVPSYKSVLWAPHICRTRKMRCPKCGERNWHKKVLK